MSDSRIIEISKPILTKVSKGEYYTLFFQESKKTIKESRGKYNVNCECHKTKIQYKT